MKQTKIAKFASRGAVLAFAGALLYAMFAVGAETGTTSDCVDEWEDAPAEAFCTDTSVEAVQRGTAGDTQKYETYCKIAVSSCAITVGMRDANNVLSSVTFNPAWNSHWAQQGVPLRMTDNFDICFKPAGQNAQVPSGASTKEGWSAFVAEGCPADARTSSQASSGL